MSRAIKVYRLGTVALSTIAIFCVCAMIVVNVAAQDVAQLLNVSNDIAETASRDMTAALLKLTGLAISGMVMQHLFFMRWTTRIAVVLEKLAGRPCFATDDDLADYLAKKGKKKGGPS